jgi:hypothetical protein
MDTVKCAVDLQVFFSELDAQYSVSRTKNVIFPSLKKYMLCRTNESSAVGLALNVEFVSLVAPRSTRAPAASVVIMCVSEPIEFMDRTERPLALDTVDRDGETRGSLILQDTMGCDMGGDVRSLSVSALYVYPLRKVVVTSYTRQPCSVLF